MDEKGQTFVCNDDRERVCENFAKENVGTWKQKVRKNDILRGTKLGILGHLPLEIRLEIWRLLFRFRIRNIWPSVEDWENVTPMHQHPVEGDPALLEPHIFWYTELSGSPHGIHKYQVKARRVLDLGQTVPFREATWDVLPEEIDRVRQASSSTRSEIDQVFFSMHQLSFDDPFDFFMFWKQLSLTNRSRLRHLALWIGMPTWTQDNYAIHVRRTRHTNFRSVTESNFYDNSSWLPRPVTKYHPHGDDEIEEWVNAITCLPSTVQSVVIHMGGVEDNEQQERRALNLITKAIKKVAADAVVIVARNSAPDMYSQFYDDETMSREKLAELDGIVDDATGSNVKELNERYPPVSHDTTRTKGRQSKKYPH